MSSHSEQTVIPSARRLTESLRDIGYDLEGAIADLVDNSIDANARRVDIRFVFEGADSYVVVSDDGIGMRPSELDEAMRYGSQRQYAHGALGQFGLGLKTASLSQCRRLSVASRSGERGRLSIRRWDLDHVAERDAWVLQSPTPRDCRAELRGPLAGKSGTVVLWERLDRILNLRRPEGAAAQRALENAARDVGTHLGMVFHRHLSGEAGSRLTITINGAPVAPWDPFARSERHTQVLPLQQLELEPGVVVEVQPYLLPHQSRFSSIDAHQAAGGPQRWNRAQGFYFYRRDRLIQGGGWNRLRTMDEHAKLARVAIDLPMGHEHLFQINVAKMRLVIPVELRPALRTVASAVVARAQRSYRDVHPAAVVDERRPATVDPSESAFELTRDWNLVLDVLADELADRESRNRILLRLANGARGTAANDSDGSAVEPVAAAG